MPTLSELGLSERNVTLQNGGYLHMVEKGEGSPVIFIHGWPGMVYEFKKVLFKHKIQIKNSFINMMMIF